METAILILVSVMVAEAAAILWLSVTVLGLDGDMERIRRRQGPE